MMKRTLAFFLSILWLLTCTGCNAPAEEPPEEQPPVHEEVQIPIDIPFQLPVYPDFSLHPAFAQNRSNLVVCSLLYEPLFELDAAFQPQGVLCKSYVISEEGLVWTLTLQDNITFSDGTPLTGEVVANALRIACGENSRFASRLSDVRQITAEEQTVVITLNQPNTSFHSLLDIPIALGDGEFPAGTGCYTLKQDDTDWTLIARTDWWQTTSLPAQEIPLTFVKKSDELVFSFDSGDVSLVDIDLMGTNSLGYSGSYETWDYSTTAMLYLGFNTSSGLCKNSGVRQAIARAIDRDSIAQVDFARHAVPAALPTHPNSPAYDTALAELLSYAPEQVEALPFYNWSVTMVVNSENSARVAAAERITEQLNAAGLPVTLQKMTFEDYTAALKSGSFDLYLAEVVLTADFDLSDLLLTGSPLNYGGWSNLETETAIQTMRTAPELVRMDAAKTLYSLLCEQVPIAPICFKNGSVLTRWGQLTGLDPIRGNVFHHLERWKIT